MYMLSEMSNGSESREMEGAECEVDKADQEADYADNLKTVSRRMLLLSLNIIY